jgi:hypothetical protein
VTSIAAKLPRLLTASSLGRYAVCPASAVLPRVESVPHERTTRGSVIHRCLELVAQVGREEALAEVPDEYRAACEAIDLDALPLDGMRWAQEVSFAYDVATGRARVIGHGLSREEAYQGLAPTEVTGTADSVGISADGLTVYVTDYKTGRTEIARAAINWQLRFLALASTRAYGAVHARVALIHIPDSGLPWYDPASFDAWEVDGVALELRRLWDRVAFAAASVAAGEPPLCTTGDLCRWCPSLPYCPAQTALVRQVARDVEEGRDLAGALTPATAAAAWERVKSIKAAVKRAESAIYTFAAGSPIPLPGGLVLGPVETTREEVDGAVARAVLGELHGWDVADRACEFSTSKAAIERALRGVAATTGKKITHLKRDALEAIGEARGITRKTTTTIKEHVPSDRAALEIAELTEAMTAGRAG